MEPTPSTHVSGASILPVNAKDAPIEGGGVRALITAEEAFPLLERRVAAARRTVDLSFRIFDTRTRLRTEEARAACAGEDWADLLAALAGRGVKVRVLISDFDPIGGAALHAAASVLRFYLLRPQC